MTLIENLIPTLAQLGGLLAVLLVSLGLFLIGASFVRGENVKEANIVYGWGAVIMVFNLAGSAGFVHFTYLAILTAFAALGGWLFLKRQGEQAHYSPLTKIVLLASPMLLVAAAMIPTQWDDLTQWLPNARFLLEHDSFPRPDLPESPSNFPAYPYGLPIVIYLASKITGFLIESAGAIFNIVLYLCFGLFTVRIANMVRLKNSSAAIPFEPGWVHCAVAALAVTILNPTWVTRLVFSSYSDPGTLVAMGMTVGLVWMALNALKTRDTKLADDFSLQAGVAACVLVGLRQSNLVLLLILFIGVAYLFWRDAELDWREFIRLSLRLMILPVVVWLAWRWQVETKIGGGEFSFRPIAEWNIVAIPDVLAEMLSVATKKGGYFGIMLVASAISIRYMWRPQSKMHRLLVLSAILFLGYNAFLLIAYISAFSDMDARRVASYWRYNTHLGGVCLLVAASVLVLAWEKLKGFRPLPGSLAAGLIVLVITIPVLMSGKLRFDKQAEYKFAREVAKELHHTLSNRDRLIQINQHGNGQYLVLMRYYLHGAVKPVVESTTWQSHKAADFRRLSKKHKATHVWVYENTKDITAAFGVMIPDGNAALLEKRRDHWQIVKLWPHPAGETS